MSLYFVLHVFFLQKKQIQEPSNPNIQIQGHSNNRRDLGAFEAVKQIEIEFDIDNTPTNVSHIDPHIYPEFQPNVGKYISFLYNIYGKHLKKSSKKRSKLGIINKNLPVSSGKWRGVSWKFPKIKSGGTWHPGAGGS